MNVLLVAKPWRGGLAHYVFSALRDACNEARWLATYPRSFAQRVRYRLDRQGWRRRIVEQVNAHDGVCVFINALPVEAPLSRPRRNVLWMTDSAKLNEASAASFGRVFISDPGYGQDVRDLVGVGRFAGVLPFAHDPTIHRPTSSARRHRDVCFLGNRDAKRDAYLERLLGEPWTSTIVGNYWLRHRLFWRHPASVKRSVPRRKMGGVYARHRVALNLHASVVRQGTNMRTFECAGYGIAQAVEHRPGLDELFEPERELLTFTDAESMVAQIDRLLGDTALRKRLAQQAATRAAAEHTYRHRVDRLLEELA